MRGGASNLFLQLMDKLVFMCAEAQLSVIVLQIDTETPTLIETNAQVLEKLHTFLYACVSVVLSMCVYVYVCVHLHICTNMSVYIWTC